MIKNSIISSMEFKNIWDETLNKLCNYVLNRDNCGEDRKEKLHNLYNYFFNFLVEENERITLLLRSIYNENKFLFSHLLRVGILSAFLAYKLELHPRLIEDSFIGGLLHDIGYLLIKDNDLFIDSLVNFLNMKKNNFLKAKDHIFKGINFLEQEEIKVNNNIIRIILLHHLWDIKEKSFFI